jgi:protein-L-isoaspartate(D-aspartate) O-methyltransferase
VQMWLVTTLPGFCMLLVDEKLDTGLIVPPKKRNAAMATVDGASLAYVTTRAAQEDGASAWEFGVHAFGPQADALAEQVTGQLREWATVHRHGPGPRYQVYPVGTPDSSLALDGPNRVIDKTRSRVAVSWPATPERAGTPSGTKPE